MAKQVFISPIDEAFLTERDTLGDLRWEGNRCYKYVELLHSTETVAGVIGDQLLYGASGGHRDNHVVLDVSDADTIVVGAGVCNSIVAGVVGIYYYMWMQIKGPTVLSNGVSGSPDYGQPIMATSVDKIFGLAIEATEAGSQLATCGIIHNPNDRTVILECPF